MTLSYVTWLIHMWHDSFIRGIPYSHVTWLMHTWHDSFICVTALIHKRDTTHPCAWLHSSVCVTCLVHVCDMTHSYVTWLIHMCDMNYSQLFLNHTWLLHMCDRTHPLFVVTHGISSCRTYEFVFCEIVHVTNSCDYFMSHRTHPLFANSSCWSCHTWLLHMCDRTHPQVWYDS